MALREKRVPLRAELKCIGRLANIQIVDPGFYKRAFWKEGDEHQREEKSHFGPDMGGEFRVLNEKAMVKKGIL